MRVNARLILCHPVLLCHPERFPCHPELVEGSLIRNNYNYEKVIHLYRSPYTHRRLQQTRITCTIQDSDIITAQIEQEPDTKTYMDANNNIRWSEGDQIVGFMKSSYGHKYKLVSSYAGKTYADFERVSSGNGGNLSAGTEWDHNVIYYPYSDAVEAAKSGSNYTLDVVLPSEQTYEADSFGNGSMAMVAVSEDNNITFRNVLGGMKLQLRGTQTVTSITLEGKNNEKLSGAATVTAYPDETKPTITMSDDASTSVTLNCGSGVQLKESTVTEFIIALPPVLFGNGFTVTVTDTDDQTYTVETDKANTVLRSSLLVMPVFKLGDPVGDGSGGETEIPVSTVTISTASLKIYEGETAQLTARVRPIDATNGTVTWSSDTPSVATVDQTGLVTAVSAGEATITAVAGGVSATCSVTVASLMETDPNYIDEYGVDHGKGISIGGTIWAPVNCGYHETDYPYGKLYQWGRKYGQGYSDEYDATVPDIRDGGISLSGGQSDDNANIFFVGDAENDYDWLYQSDDTLWNIGTESDPVKTEYDPCPAGWRVPTYAELDELRKNKSSWTTNDKNQAGYWYSGQSSYTSTVPQVFFPAAGHRYYLNGSVEHRRYNGYYWSSRPYNYYDNLFSNHLYLSYGYTYVTYERRADGCSVRCVQATDEVAEL